MNIQNKNYKFVVKKLKKEELYRNYKNYFHHKSTRFVLIYIVSFFNSKKYSDEEIKKLINLEFELIKKITRENFAQVFLKLAQFLPKQYKYIDWNNYGCYFFYVWQTSLFYFDRKHGNTNIYISSNYIELNSQKRNFYNEWINSLMKCDIHFNLFILFLKKKGI